MINLYLMVFGSAAETGKLSKTAGFVSPLLDQPIVLATLITQTHPMHFQGASNTLYLSLALTWRAQERERKLQNKIAPAGLGGCV